MIQRKQTIFLALAVLSLLQLFLFPVYSFERQGDKADMLVYGVKYLYADGRIVTEFANMFLPMILLTVSSIIVLVVTVFLYKRRMVQVKLCNLATLLIAGLIVAIFYFAEDLKLASDQAGYRPGVIIPLVALLLTVLANRFIKKDEELVRSADRLR